MVVTRRRLRNELARANFGGPSDLPRKTCIAGTRIPVYLILNLLAAGYNYDRIMQAYPGLTREDIEAAISYAEQRMR